MDYKTLLLKYITHVVMSEGMDYTQDHWRHEHIQHWVKFTDEEWAELKRLAAEVA